MDVFVCWEYRGKTVCRFYENEAEAAEAAQWAEKQGLTHVVVEPLEMSLDHFKRLCEQHDLTYTYSDNYRAWQNGLRERRRILHMRDALGPSEKAACARIWNDVVRSKIIPEAAKQFTWKETDPEQDTGS